MSWYSSIHNRSIDGLPKIFEHFKNKWNQFKINFNKLKIANYDGQEQFRELRIAAYLQNPKTGLQMYISWIF